MILKYVKCNHCGSAWHVKLDDNLEKFEGDENEFLQNECLKLQKRLDKLQYKHDFEDLSSGQLEDVNMKISALTKIKDILERCI